MKKRYLLTALISSSLLTTPVIASAPDPLAAPQEPQTEAGLQMPDTMEELWAMYLDLMEKYTDLEVKYEELLNKTEAEENKQITIDPDAKYISGAYKVGSTIPAGEYIFYPNAGDSVYVEVTSDPNGHDTKILHYCAGNCFATIYDGEYLTIEDGYAVPYTGNEPVDDSHYDYTAKVGDQIEAGEYLAKSIEGEKGYYSVSSNSRFDDTVTMDYFENTSYLYLQDGQYIEIEDCELIKQ